MTGRKGTTHIVVLGILTGLILCTICSRPVRAADISVSATLSPTTFSVDDGARLTITVNGTQSAELEIPATDADRFAIVQRGRSSQFNMINGRFSSAITFTCLVEGYKAGNYSIPPITIHADNTSKITEAIPFTVTEALPTNLSTGGSGALPQSQASGAGADTVAAFIRLIAAKTTGYVGELMPVEVKAYFRSGLRANLNSTPTLVGDGLLLPQLNEKPQQSEEMVGNSRYSVLTWHTALSNIKEGEHTIHLELNATLLLPQRRMASSIFGQNSPFDNQFFDNFFNGYKEKPIKAVSDELAFTLLPLPEKDRPSDFTGAIGDFNLEVVATPKQAETGEPLTLTMTISGTGNFDRVRAPSFPATVGWKTYSPSTTFTGNASTSGGNKVFEQAIVARNGEVSEIPSLRFSYFDPQQQRYITRRSAPIPVTIVDRSTPVAAPAVPATIATGATTPQTTPAGQTRQPSPQSGEISGLAPLHLQAGSGHTAITPLYARPLFLAMVILCGLLLLAAALVRFWRIRQSAHPDEQRKKQLTRMLQQACSELDHAATEGNSALFLARCRSVIQNQLGAIWNRQPDAITRADLAVRLPHGNRLIEIFTVAEQAAYSGAWLQVKEMTDYAATIKDELEGLS
ncbi:MAG: BatD family protein [Desulfopila sp.]